jgi:hypothetical protein
MLLTMYRLCYIILMSYASPLNFINKEKNDSVHFFQLKRTRSEQSIVLTYLYIRILKIEISDTTSFLFIVVKSSC